MPRKTFQKVYLHDNYPSDISACMTIRESLWNIVSTIESEEERGQLGDTAAYSLDFDDVSLSMNKDHDLPLTFGKQPPLKKMKRQKKKCNNSKSNNYNIMTLQKGIDQKFKDFSETRSAHNVYMGYNESDGLSYPCRVVGVGPHTSTTDTSAADTSAGTSTSQGREFAVVQFIGYGTVAELERSVALQPIPVERINEIQEFIMHETLFRAMGGVENIKKYYDQRYRLFSKFDEGVLLDEESWFSITPECIAFDIASKCQAQAQRKGVRLGVVLDCFSGVGGNAIAMAAGTQCQVVCAGDIDARKLDMLSSNARVYGVRDKIECVHEDAYVLLSNLAQQRQRQQHQHQHSAAAAPPPLFPSLSPPLSRAGGREGEEGGAGTLVDILVLAPPWGGIEYTNTNSAFNIRTMITSGDGAELFRLARQVCCNIVYILPKNTKKKDLLDLATTAEGAGTAAGGGVYCRVEDVYIHNKLKLSVAYYGPLFSSS